MCTLKRGSPKLIGQFESTRPDSARSSPTRLHRSSSLQQCDCLFRCGVCDTREPSQECVDQLGNSARESAEHVPTAEMFSNVRPVTLARSYCKAHAALAPALDWKRRVAGALIYRRGALRFWACSLRMITARRAGHTLVKRIGLAAGALTRGRRRKPTQRRARTRPKPNPLAQQRQSVPFFGFVR